MIRRIAGIIVISAIIFPIFAGIARRPDYIQCQSSAECRRGHCCAIGATRYSIPQCMAMAEEGDDCRPRSEPINTTLLYPDGSQVTLTDVSYIMCSCRLGLVCDNDGICKDLSQKRGFNHLLGDYSAQDD